MNQQDLIQKDLEIERLQDIIFIIGDAAMVCESCCNACYDYDNCFSGCMVGEELCNRLTSQAIRSYWNCDPRTYRKED